MRQNRIVWAVACGLLLVSGCGKTEVKDFKNFKDFTSVDGKFKVRMPEKPNEEMQFAAGLSMKVYSVQENDGAYAVAFADIPMFTKESDSQIQTRLDGARDGMVRNINATLTSASSITLSGGHPGREVRADLPGKKGILRARIYFVDNRLYQIMVVGAKSWTNSTNATRFLDSFALKP